MVARFHYDDATFRRLVNDQLPSQEENEVTSHIERCADCQAQLEAVSEADIRWSDVRRFLSPQAIETSDLASSTAGPGQTARSTDERTIEFLAPSDQPNSLGRFGRYEITEVLGRGGMGVVMRGYDPALDRHSAIKVLAPELATNASARNRFAREAKSAAAVVHEHVVPIQTVDEERGLPYLVMPVVEGQSLEQRVAQSGPLAVVEILRIGMQTASGLAAAHSQGLVHRDVKPANILLENGVERVMITDFGLARAVDDASMTRSGVIAGTPQYMSPEQARGNDVDHRSDLFSLGSVLYCMCTGRSPFRAETMMGVLNRIANDTPRPIRKINPDIPEWLCQIIAKLMSKQRDDRFESACEVAELLEECLAHVQQPTAVSLPASLVTQSKGSRFFSSSRRSAGVIAMIAAFGFSLLGMVLWQATTPPDIAGRWRGEKWGEVMLEQKQPSKYEGTYTGTTEDKPGSIQVKWSRIERRYNGTWREGKDRYGKISVRLVDDEIRGAWTTSKKSDAKPGTPKLADLCWVRSTEPRAVDSDPEYLVGPWKARLPSGVMVELLGVAENPSKGRPWWRPDGSPLAKPPYDWLGASVKVDKNEMAREFAVRLSNTPSEPVGIQWKITPCSKSAGRGAPRLTASAPDIQGVAAQIPASQRTADVQIGVAAGAWQTAFESQAAGGDVVGGKKSVVFSPAQEKDGGITMTVAHNMIHAHGEGPQVRVIAVDVDGREHRWDSAQDGRAGKISQLTVTFSNLSLEDVKTFRVVTRPYQWAEFRNVSLQPGQESQAITPAPESGSDPPIDLPSMEPTSKQEDRKALVVVDSADYGDTESMMKLVELERNAKTSKLRLTYKKLSSPVGSSMFILWGLYEVAKARGTEYFISLESGSDVSGETIFIAGFTNTEDADIRKAFGGSYSRTTDHGQPLKYWSVSEWEFLCRGVSWSPPNDDTVAKAEIAAIRLAADKQDTPSEKHAVLTGAFAKSDSPHVKMRILEMAKVVEAPELEPFLLSILQNKTDVRDRILAVMTLAEHGSTAAIEPLLDCAENDPEGVAGAGCMRCRTTARRDAYLALAEIGLRHPAERNRIAAAVAALPITTDDVHDPKAQTLYILTQDQRHLKLFLDRLQDEDPETRALGVRALRPFKLSHAPEQLVATLADSNPDVQARAARLLGIIGDSKTIPALIEAATATDRDRQVRSNAIRALGSMRVKQAESVMRKLLTDDSVKVVAAIALFQITGERHPLLPQGFDLEQPEGRAQ